MGSKARGGLGKGLGALLQSHPIPDPSASLDTVQEIPVARIQANRYQPRKEFDEKALEDLKTSIQTYGVIQPILVRKLPNEEYELIAGERRLRAAKLAGVSEIPAMIREYNDAETSEIALIENIQRENLNVVEEALAYQRLMKEFQLTQEAMAEKLGRSRSHIANILRLLKLAPKVQDYLSNGSLSMGQARPLLSLESHEMQCEAASIIQEQELSARQAEALVKRLQEKPHADENMEEREDKSQDVHVRDAEEKLRHCLGTQVKIFTGKKKSRIEIEFYSEEDLERIIQQLTAEQADLKQKKIEALRRFSSQQGFLV
mgnify:CR=1 FL=1